MFLPLPFFIVMQSGKIQYPHRH